MFLVPTAVSALTAYRVVSSYRLWTLQTQMAHYRDNLRMKSVVQGSMDKLSSDGRLCYYKGRWKYPIQSAPRVT